MRSGNLGLHDEPLLDRLAEATERPRLLVAAAAAAAGEAAGGTLALVQIGSGLAGHRPRRRGRVQRDSRLAGEVGHVVFVPGGRRCRCGRAGCVEAYAGLAALPGSNAELGRPAPSARQLLLDAAADANAAAALDDAVAAVAFAAVAVLVSASDPGTLRLGSGRTVGRDAAQRGVGGSRAAAARGAGVARVELSEAAGASAAPRPAAVRRRDLTERRLTAAPSPMQGRVASPLGPRR